MIRDPLGDQFKAIEAEWKPTIPAKSFMVIRADGRAFHTWTRGLDRPFDQRFAECMDMAAEQLGKAVSGALCVFVQSDEISVVTQDLGSHGAEHWFGGVVQKVASNSAAIATAGFNDATHDWPSLARSKPSATFDARCFPLTELEQVADYLSWRQKDAFRNGVSMLSHHHLGKAAVKGVPTKDRIVMLQNVGVMVHDPILAPHMHGRLWAPETRRGLVRYTRKDTGEQCSTMADRTVWEPRIEGNVAQWFMARFTPQFGDVA